MIEVESGKIFDFGPFRLDARLRQLTRRTTGERIQLSPKALEVLVVLVRNAGAIVTKDQLLDEVWDNVFVEEANLSQTVFVLRKALGDESKSPAYILTVPNRGYRMVAEVLTVPDNDQESFGDKPLTDGSARPDEPNSQTTRAFALIAVLATIAIISFVFLGLGSRDGSNRSGPTAVAIIPFRNLGPAEDDYLAAGLSETMTTRLARLGGIVVRPTSSSLKYAGSTVDPRTIGDDLGADLLVTGSFQRMGESVRINAQIIRVRNGATIWGRIYDDRARGMFGVQDRMSLDLAEALVSELSIDERERIARNYTSNPDAQQAYFQGIFLWNKRSPQALRDAILEFRKAIEIEPGYAPAYIGLANCYAVLSNYGAERPTIANPKAREAIDQALAIDDRLAEAYAARGTIEAYYDWNWTAAETSFRRSIELQPNYATGHQWYAEFLFDIKKYDEAFEHYDAALRLNPRSPTIRTSYASRFLYLGEYEKVIDLMKAVHQLDPAYGYSYFHEALAYEMLGRERDAFESFAKLMTLQGEPEDCVSEARAAFERGGMKEYWKVRLDQFLTREHLRNAPPIGTASIYSRLGDKEKTIEFLQKAVAEHDPWVAGLGHPIHFGPVADDPRFQSILRQLNFPR